MAEQIFKKKTEWSDEINNYVGESEITVTITIAEYRELIKDNAVWERKYTDIVSKKNDLEIKVGELEKQIESYKEVFQLKEEE